jgi:hypothetical protein
MGLTATGKKLLIGFVLFICASFFVLLIVTALALESGSTGAHSPSQSEPTRNELWRLEGETIPDCRRRLQYRYTSLTMTELNNICHTTR